MNFSNYLEEKLLGVTLLGSPFTAPATIWGGLATACSSDGTVFTEVATGAYTRKVIPFGVPADGATGTTTIVQFPTATVSWGQVTHVALFDAESSGNMLYWGAVETAIWVNPGKRVTYLANDLIVSLD